MFYHARKLDRRADISSIVIDAEDRDVVVISSYASFQFEKDLLLYRKKKFVMCKGLCPPEMSSVIIPLHSMTGADAVSGFYGRSKKAIYEKVRRSTEAQLLISNLGKHVVLSQPDIKKCSTFLVKSIYDDKSSHIIAEARAKMWRGTKNKTTLRLPPDEDSFIQHLLRANYQAKIWCEFGIPDGPQNPLDHGYKLDGLLVLPNPHTKEACPSSLRDFVLEATPETESDSSSDDETSDYNSSSDED